MVMRIQWTKIFGIVARWLFILCLPALLLTTSIGLLANSQWLYEYGFDKYNVSQTTGLAASELENIAAGIIIYFNSGEEYISLTVVKDGKPFNLFTPEETIHFRDVKGLIWLDYWVMLGTGIYAVSYTGISLFWRKKEYRRRLAWQVVGGSSLTLALMLVLGLGTLLDFDQLLLQFHLISFSNEYWSAEGYMLLLFPELLYDATLFCALGTVLMAVILGGVAGGYLLIKRRALSQKLKNS